MAEKKDILAKLSESRQEAVKANAPTTPQGKKDLKDLLHFGILSQGQTTKDSRLEVRAILLAAVSSGMPLDVAKSLKKTLRDSPPERTKELLGDINKPGMTVKSVLSKFLTEKQVGAKLTPIDSTTLPGVKILDGATVNVSPVTMQNLDVAHAVNFAVKSIITDGAPNQAPDVVRTDGRNVLLYEGSPQQVRELLNNDKQYNSDMQRLAEVNRQLEPKIGDINYELPFVGEAYSIPIDQSQISAIMGTGKCGEHAATSFALLTDPKSLAQLGAKIPDGSTVILALGDKIDHSYVLIAGPGSVEIENTKERRVRIVDSDSVVVVDPWMPIPIAHTLSRCNIDIQINPLCKVVAVMKEGQPHVLARNGEEILIPKGGVSALDQLNNLKDKYRASMLKDAEEMNLVPGNKEKSLALACAKLVCSVKEGKEVAYESSHLSTDTPKDLYQCVDSPKDSDGIKIGEPVSYFVANKKSLENTHESIQSVKNTGIRAIAVKPENLKLLPEKERKDLLVAATGKKTASKVEPTIEPIHEPVAQVQKQGGPNPTTPSDDLQMNGVTPSKLEEPKKDIQERVETGKPVLHRYGNVKDKVAQIEKQGVKPAQPKNDIQQEVETARPDTGRYGHVKDKVTQIEKKGRQATQEHGAKTPARPFPM